MTNTDGERIAPVTYLFGQRQAAHQEEAVSGEPDSPSAVSPVLVDPVLVDPVLVDPVLVDRVLVDPVFLDLGTPGAADERISTVRAALEEEARTHVSRDRAEAEAPARKGKASFEPINNVSMHALARRGMSSREMHDYLVGREFEPADVDVEIERLESVALLDDVALGETLVRTLRDRKGYGRSALTAELRRRRLDQTAIELALDGLDDDELERATEIAHKRASQLRSYDAETAKRRLGAFLMRKGYSGSVVSTAVQRALAPAGPTFR